ncbi:ABC transporter ATP-binding protein, partial [Clostridium saudiense]|nr:ABC transporter ATP-binding protein [Clostridium saudiense]
IAPISIAIITNTIISIVLYMINPWFGLLSVVFFLIVGFVIPYTSSSLGKDAGVAYRNMFGECNNYILDSLRGLKEVLLFKNGEERLREINSKSHRINESLDKIKEHEGIIRAVTDLTIMIAILTFVGLGFYQYSIGNLSFTWMLVGIVIIASSFGPVVALSNLSNTLLQTFACAERLFDLIDEEPHVEEVLEGYEISGDSISYEDVTFTYPNRKEKIFDSTSVHIEKGDKIALIGESGIGKSTFVKLMMRFWDVNEGKIKLDNKNIKEVTTNSIRNTQTLVSQETYLFNESILDNIRIGNVNATKDEVIKAAKMASIHEFIETLPKGYDTKVGELGGNLSSGEKQRIGLARAFLSDGDILILDEPTSNLDTLNEGEILKSIKENCEDKTIVLISHRKSTTAVCNKTYKLENSKLVIN